MLWSQIPWLRVEGLGLRVVLQKDLKKSFAIIQTFTIPLFLVPNLPASVLMFGEGFGRRVQSKALKPCYASP